jgi:hypothetical protein
MRTSVRIGVKVLAALFVAGIAGQALARRRTVGDETSDEFELPVYFGGVDRGSTAAALRRGVVSAFCGGVDLDLREATLAPGGATLDLSATWGGIDAVVPRSWKVLVDGRSLLGGFDARVTPPDDLPDDAPRLDVSVTARLGGVSIRAADPGERP